MTGLTCGQYCDASGREVPCPDDTAGLYIRARDGEVVRAAFKPTQLAFQMGQATQIHSGGLLRATPHCVRAAGGPAAAGVARNAFAVFMQPNWDGACPRYGYRGRLLTCTLSILLTQRPWTRPAALRARRWASRSTKRTCRSALSRTPCWRPTTEAAKHAPPTHRTQKNAAAYEARPAGSARFKLARRTQLRDSLFVLLEPFAQLRNRSPLILALLEAIEVRVRLRPS